MQGHLVQSIASAALAHAFCRRLLAQARQSVHDGGIDPWFVGITNPLYYLVELPIVPSIKIDTHIGN
jgi:hypothetical protein